MSSFGANTVKIKVCSLYNKKFVMAINFALPLELIEIKPNRGTIFLLYQVTAKII